MKKGLFNVTVAGFALGMTLFTVQTIMAGTWVGPGTARPTTSNVPPIQTSGIDGLGSHTAMQDVDLNSHRIINVGSSLGEWALTATNTGTGVAAHIDAVSGYGAQFVSNNAGVGAEINNTNPVGIGLRAESVGAISAYFEQRVDAVSGQVQLSTSPNDILSLTNSGVAGQDLYWGSKLLCDADDINLNCGHSAAVLDNLGDHQADSDLNLAGHRIINIQDSPNGLLSDLRLALDGSNSGSGVGLNTYSAYLSGGYVSANGNTAAGAMPASLYAYNQGAGYGLWAKSATGEAARLKGRLTIDRDSTINHKPEIIFNNANNSLSTEIASSQALATIYWGDRKLCAGTQEGCGFVAGDPLYKFWVTESDSDLFSDKFVSIGGPSESKAKLEILPPTNASFEVVQSVRAGSPTSADMAIQGDKLYLLWTSSTLNESWLKIYDISSLTAPTFLGEYKVYTDDTANDIAVSGQYAYITDSSATVDLHVIDVSNPAAMTEVKAFNWGSGNLPRSINVAGHYAYIVEQGAMTIIDISTPVFPTNNVIVAHKTWEGMDQLEGYNSYLAGNYIYSADGSAGVHVIDISNPSDPLLIDNSVLAGGANDLLARGNILYVAATGYLHSLNISNPINITLLGSLSLPRSLSSLGIGGNYLYGIGNLTNASLQIIDISDPTNMAVQVFTTAKEGVALIISGSQAYTSGDGAELNTINIAGANFNNLWVGLLETDNLNVDGAATVNSGMYIHNGLNLGGNLTVSSGNLATAGYLQIGDEILTEQLLKELLEWLAS